MLKQKGFTLLELMVVIVIISLIASLVGVNLLKRLSKSKIAAAQAQIELFSCALESYKLDNDMYPTTDQGLEALRKEPTIEPFPKNWDGPYLKKEIPKDPWGNDYVYVCPPEKNPDPTSFDLISYGADGKEGGEGENQDICNWKNVKKKK